MALATYTDLLATIPKFLQNRADLAALLPDIVTLAQTRINNDLTVGTAEVEIPLTATIGSRFIDVSTLAINEPRGLWMTWFPVRQPVDFIPAEDLTISVSPGLPLYWTIDNQQIAFNRPCDQAYTFAFRIVQSWALSAANPTNYLMTNYPNVYLYAALCECAPYLSGKDTALIAKWEAKYRDAVQGAQQNLGRWRNALANGRVDVALLQRRPIFNIYQGT